MITRKGLDETVAPCVPEHRGRRWRRSHGLSDPRSPAGAARRPATAVGSLRGSATTFCLRVLPVVLGVAVAALGCLRPAPADRRRVELHALAGRIRFAIDGGDREARQVDQAIGGRRHQRELVGTRQRRGSDRAGADGRDGGLRHPRHLPSGAVRQDPRVRLRARHSLPDSGVRRSSPLGLLPAACRRRRQGRPGVQIVLHDWVAAVHRLSRCHAE